MAARRLSPLVSAALGRIDAFLPASGMSATALGLRVMNDGKIVGRLRRGLGVTARTIDRLNGYIDRERRKARAVCLAKYSRRRRGGNRR